MAESLLWLAGFLIFFGVLAARWLAASKTSLPEPVNHLHPDTQLLTWILWWVRTALGEAPRSLFDAPIFYPLPGQLTGSDHFLSVQLVFAPLFALVGNPIQAASLTVWLVRFPLTAWAMSRLLQGIGLSRWAVLGGSLLYVFGIPGVVPTVHVLHTIGLFLPLAGLTLYRLRREPTIPRAIAFGAVFLAGLLSSFYLAAMLLVVTSIWAAAEVVSPEPGRLRFAWMVVVVSLACLAMFVWFSLPYFGRGEVWQLGASVQRGVIAQRIIGWAALHNPVVMLGGWGTIVLAGLGLATRRREYRRLALAALAMVAVGFFLLSGGLHELAGLPMPEALRFVLLLPSRFFRMASRLTLLTGFGMTFLGALALDRAARARPRLAAVGVLGLAVLLTATRGRALYGVRLVEMKAASVDRERYVAVGEIARRYGSGPLLELPLHDRGADLQGRHMIGSIWHRQPIITGHTGYPPASAAEVDALTRELPRGPELRELIKRTGLRWILLRPEVLANRAVARRYVQRLGRSPRVERIVRVGGWWLVQLRPPAAAASEPATDVSRRGGGA